MTVEIVEDCKIDPAEYSRLVAKKAREQDAVTSDVMPFCPLCMQCHRVEELMANEFNLCIRCKNEFYFSFVQVLVVKCHTNLDGPMIAPR